MDAAGNGRSSGVHVVRTGSPTTLAIAPSTLTLALDESRSLTATNEYGNVTTDVTWRFGDPTLLSVSPEGRVLAAQAGDVVVTATADGLLAQAAIVVMNTALTAGTVKWTASPTPGFSAGAPIYANRVDVDGADLFSVETDYGDLTVVKAMRADGVPLWTETIAGTVLFGDTFGGIVAVDTPPSLGYTGGQSLTRIGATGEAAPWRYEAAGDLGTLPIASGIAQAPDGTIYLVERQPDGSASVVGLNGTRASQVQNASAKNWILGEDITSLQRATHINHPVNYTRPIPPLLALGKTEGLF
jgi:hypothetical protein